MEKQIKREGREVSRKEARAKESEEGHDEWNVIASCSVMQCAVAYYIVVWFCPCVAL